MSATVLYVLHAYLRGIKKEKKKGWKGREGKGREGKGGEKEDLGIQRDKACHTQIHGWDLERSAVGEPGGQEREQKRNLTLSHAHNILEASKKPGINKKRWT